MIASEMENDAAVRLNVGIGVEGRFDKLHEAIVLLILSVETVCGSTAVSKFEYVKRLASGFVVYYRRKE